MGSENKERVAIKERPTGPIRTYDETDVLKSSNTWEFLIFEQLRAIRFIQQNIFSEPRTAKFHILNLLTSMNHLESMLYDRINPNYEANTDAWTEYQKRKPAVFKNMHSDVSRVSDLVNSNELDQFKLVALVEMWFRALDKYLNSIKRISPTMFEMRMPDAVTPDMEITADVSVDSSPPDPTIRESYIIGGESDASVTV